MKLVFAGIAAVVVLLVIILIASQSGSDSDSDTDGDEKDDDKKQGDLLKSIDNFSVLALKAFDESPYSPKYFSFL